MSTKSKASRSTKGCCIRKGTLSINPFTQEIYGLFDWYLGDPSVPYQPSGLEGPLNTGTISIRTDASDQCQDKAKRQIIQFMRNAIAIGFMRWLRRSNQVNLAGGVYNWIRFLSLNDWEFEMLCCDETNQGGIITDFRSFPRVYGIYLFTGGVDPNINLQPPIICSIF